MAQRRILSPTSQLPTIDPRAITSPTLRDSLGIDDRDALRAERQASIDQERRQREADMQVRHEAAQQAQAAQQQEAQNRRTYNATTRAQSSVTGQQTTMGADGYLQPQLNPLTGKQDVTDTTGAMEYDANGQATQMQRRDANWIEHRPDENAKVGPNPYDPNDPGLYRKNTAKEWDYIDPKTGSLSADPETKGASIKKLRHETVSKLNEEASLAKIATADLKPGHSSDVIQKARERIAASQPSPDANGVLQPSTADPADIDLVTKATKYETAQQRIAETQREAQRVSKLTNEQFQAENPLPDAKQRQTALREQQLGNLGRVEDTLKAERQKLLDEDQQLSAIEQRGLTSAELPAAAQQRAVHQEKLKALAAKEGNFKKMLGTVGAPQADAPAPTLAPEEKTKRADFMAGDDGALFGASERIKREAAAHQEATVTFQTEREQRASEVGDSEVKKLAFAHWEADKLRELRSNEASLADQQEIIQTAQGKKILNQKAEIQTQRQKLEETNPFAKGLNISKRLGEVDAAAEYSQKQIAAMPDGPAKDQAAAALQKSYAEQHAAITDEVQTKASRFYELVNALDEAGGKQRAMDAISGTANKDLYDAQAFAIQGDEDRAKMLNRKGDDDLANQFRSRKDTQDTVIAHADAEAIAKETGLDFGTVYKMADDYRRAAFKGDFSKFDSVKLSDGSVVVKPSAVWSDKDIDKALANSFGNEQATPEAMAKAKTAALELRNDPGMQKAASDTLENAFPNAWSAYLTEHAGEPMRNVIEGFRTQEHLDENKWKSLFTGNWGSAKAVADKVFMGAGAGLSGIAQMGFGTASMLGIPGATNTGLSVRQQDGFAPAMESQNSILSSSVKMGVEMLPLFLLNPAISSAGRAVGIGNSAARAAATEVLSAGNFAKQMVANGIDRTTAEGIARAYATSNLDALVKIAANAGEAAGMNTASKIAIFATAGMQSAGYVQLDATEAYQQQEYKRLLNGRTASDLSPEENERLRQESISAAAMKARPLAGLAGAVTGMLTTLLPKGNESLERFAMGLPARATTPISEIASRIGMQKFGSFLKSGSFAAGVSSFAITLGIHGADEFIEEFADELFQQTQAALTYSPDTSFGDVLAQALDAGGLGGIMGLGGGTVSGLHSFKASRALNSNTTAQAIQSATNNEASRAVNSNTTAQAIQSATNNEASLALHDSTPSDAIATGMAQHPAGAPDMQEVDTALAAAKNLLNKASTPTDLAAAHKAIETATTQRQQVLEDLAGKTEVDPQTQQDSAAELDAAENPQDAAVARAAVKLHQSGPQSMDESDLATLGLQRTSNGTLKPASTSETPDSLPRVTFGPDGQPIFSQGFLNRTAEAFPATGKLLPRSEMAQRALATPKQEEAKQTSKSGAGQPQQTFDVEIEGMTELLTIPAKNEDDARTQAARLGKGLVLSVSLNDTAEQSSPNGLQGDPATGLGEVAVDGARTDSPHETKDRIAPDDTKQKIISGLSPQEVQASGISNILDMPKVAVAKAPTGLLSAHFDEANMGGKVQFVFDGRKSAEAFMKQLGKTHGKSVKYGINDVGSMSIVNALNIDNSGISDVLRAVNGVVTNKVSTPKSAPALGTFSDSSQAAPSPALGTFSDSSQAAPSPTSKVIIQDELGNFIHDPVEALGMDAQQIEQAITATVPNATEDQKKTYAKMAASLAKELIRWKKVFPKAIQGTDAGGGLAVNRETGSPVLMINFARLAKTADFTGENAGQWAKLAVQEEAIHAAGVMLEQQGKWNAAELYAALPASLKAKVAASYASNDPSLLGHEFMRMLIQGRLNGEVLTELTAKPGVIKKIKAALRSLLDYFRNLSANLTKDGAAPETIQLVNDVAASIEAKLAEFQSPETSAGTKTDESTPETNDNGKQKETRQGKQTQDGLLTQEPATTAGEKSPADTLTAAAKRLRADTDAQAILEQIKASFGKNVLPDNEKNRAREIPEVSRGKRGVGYTVQDALNAGMLTTTGTEISPVAELPAAFGRPVEAAKKSTAKPQGDNSAKVEGGLIDRIKQRGGILSKAKALQSRGREWFAKNKSQWDDAGDLGTEPGMWSQSDLEATPNKIAHEMGLDLPAFWAQLRGELKTRKTVNKDGGKSPDEVQGDAIDSELKAQAREFRQATAQSGERNDIKLQPSMLEAGAMVQVDGEKMTVVRVDQNDDGTVTAVLEDGAKFGRQYIDTGETIWVEDVEDEAQRQKVAADIMKEFRDNPGMNFEKLAKRSGLTENEIERLKPIAEKVKARAEADSNKPLNSAQLDLFADNQVDTLNLGDQTKPLSTENLPDSVSTLAQKQMEQLRNKPLTGTAGDMTPDMLDPGTEDNVLFTQQPKPEELPAPATPEQRSAVIRERLRSEFPDGFTMQMAYSAYNRYATDQIDRSSSYTRANSDINEWLKNGSIAEVTEETIRGRETKFVFTPTPAEVPTVKESFTVQPVTNLTSLQSLLEKIPAGEITADQIKTAWEEYKTNEIPIRLELSKMTMKQLEKYQSFRKPENKADAVRMAVDHLESYFNPTDMLQYGGSITGLSGIETSKRQAMDKVVAQWTDETIQKQAAERKAAIADRERARTNPETKEEWRQFVFRKGRTSLTKEEVSAILANQKTVSPNDAVIAKGESLLTPEELATYDNVMGIDRKSKAQAALERTAQVRGVNAGTEANIIETKHTKTGEPLFVVQLSDRVERSVYDSLNKTAKTLGGWYSSYKVGGAVPGFQFKTKAQAEQFQSASKGETVDRTEQIQERQAEKKNAAAERLNAVADKMIERSNQILEADRKTNTAKRAREAGYAESKANEQIALAKTIKNLADAIESGEATHLDGVRAVTQIEVLKTLAKMSKDQAERGQNLSYQERENKKGETPTPEQMASAVYPFPYLDQSQLMKMVELGRKTDGAKMVAERVAKIRVPNGEAGYIQKPDDIENIRELSKKVSERGKALWEDISWKFDNYDRVQAMGLTDLPALRAALREFTQFQVSRKGEDPLKKMERELVGVNMPGFFPTPPAVIDRMLEEAGDLTGLHVLEPSAGKGDIAEAALKAGAKVDAIEMQSRLRDILRAKGMNVINNDFMADDATDQQYDAVLMNPPFEDGQDMEHVMRAFTMLKPGGKLVAIMSEGPFGRSDKKSVAFREWLDANGGTSEKLPEGSFKSAFRSTGVATRLVTVESPTTTALRTQSFEDMLRNAGVDLNELDDLTEQATNEKSGERTIGNPELSLGGGVNSAADPTIMATDALRKKTFVPETFEEWRDKARTLLEEDYAGTVNYIIEYSFASGGQYLTREHNMAAQMIVERESRLPMTPERVRLIQALIWAYRMSGTEQARDLASRRDPFKTPVERHREFIAKSILTPPANVRKRIEEAKTREEKERIMEVDRKTRIAKIEKAFASMGLTMEDLLNGEVRLGRLKDASVQAAFSTLASPVRDAVTMLQDATKSFKDVAKATGLKEADIRKAKFDTMEKIREDIRRRAALAASASTISSQSFDQEGIDYAALGAMSDADREAAIDRLMQEMGFFSDDQQGKRKTVKRPKSKLFVPPSSATATGPKSLTPRLQVPPSGNLAQFGGPTRGIQTGLPLNGIPVENQRQTTMTGPGDVSALEPQNRLGEQRVPAAGTGSGKGGPVGVSEKGTDRNDPAADHLGKLWVDGPAEVSVRTGADMANPEDMARLARIAQAAEAGPLDMVKELWINSILSGPATHFANIVGNAASGAWDFTVQRGMEALWNLAIRDKKGATIGEMGHILKSLTPAIARGLRFMAKAWNTESDFFAHQMLQQQGEFFESGPKGEHHKVAIAERATEQALSKIGLGKLGGAIDDTLGKIPSIKGRSLNPFRGRVIRIPGRALMAMDGFFKGMFGTMEVAAQAYRIAKSEGLKGDALQGRLNELVNTPGSHAWELAVNKAQELIFQQDLPESVKAFQKLVNSTKIGTFLFPFVKTPYNILRTGIRKSPVGMLNLAYQIGKHGLAKIKPDGSIQPAGSPEMIKILAEQTLATLATFILAPMFGGDDDDDKKDWLITGSPSREKGQRMLEDRAFGGSFQIKTPFGAINYGRMEPLATVLGTMADGMKAWKSGATSSQFGAAIIDNVKGQVMNKSFLSGLSGIIEGLNRPGKWTEKAQNAFLSALVPNLLRQPLRSADPTERDYETASWFYPAWPSEELAGAPKVDPMTGAEKAKGGNAISRMLTPPTAPRGELSPVDRVLLAWNRQNPTNTWAPEPPDNTITYKERQGNTPAVRVELNAKGRNFLEVRAATIARNNLKGRNFNPVQKDIEEIQQVFTKARSQARDELKRWPVATVGTIKE